MNFAVKETLRIDAGFETGDGEEAANHESGEDEKAHGKGDLGDDETGTNARTLSRSVYVDARGLQAGAKIFLTARRVGERPNRRVVSKERTTANKSAGKLRDMSASPGTSTPGTKRMTCRPR